LKRKNALAEALQQMVNEGAAITRESLKLRYEQLLEPKIAKPTIEKKWFKDYGLECINHSISGERLNNGQRIRANTIKSYKTTFLHLTNFEKHCKQRYDIQEIDRVFYTKFINYLNGIDLSVNSVGKQVKNIKVFVNYAFDRGAEVNRDVRSKFFKTISEDTDQIYLNAAELEKIRTVNLPIGGRLSHARDLFLIACNTGLRFGDLNIIKASNINSDNQLVLPTQKTGKKVIIPLNWVVLEILERNGNQPPKAMSNQKLNKYIKEVCQLAGINDILTTAKTKSGIKVEQTKEKWEFVTVHTARRSFATNLYLNNMDMYSIMMMTGHTSEKVFLKYIRVTELENARRVANHAFFNSLKP
jgi:site-specific recombinase XerD